MTKKEIYSAIQAKGVSLPRSCQFMKLEDLNKIYEQTFGCLPGEQKEQEKEHEFYPHVIKFIDSGWCPELRKSYFAGTVIVKNQKEYDALKKYAHSDEVLQ